RAASAPWRRWPPSPRPVGVRARVRGRATAPDTPPSWWHDEYDCRRAWDSRIERKSAAAAGQGWHAPQGGARAAARGRARGVSVRNRGHRRIFATLLRNGAAGGVGHGGGAGPWRGLVGGRRRL